MGNLPSKGHSFEYDDQLQDREFRLLTLQPGDFGKPLTGHLSVTNLEAEPEYAALSYCWGSNKRSHSMDMNGHRFGITKSVFEALQHLKSSTECVTIWIDQLCINQDDVAERSAQVKHMDKIYGRAKATFIWLGLARPGMEHALTTLKECWCSDIDTDWMHRSLGVLRCMLSSAYFNRVWVLQEAVLSRHCVIMYGQNSWDIEELSKTRFDLLMAILISEALHAKLSPQERESRLLLQHDLDSFYYARFGSSWKESGRQIFNALNEGRQRQCSDLRDHIIGLQGLFACQLHLGYDMDVVEIFATATKEGLRETHGNVSWLFSHNESGERMLEAPTGWQKALPSWIPDWSQPRAAPFFSVELYHSGGIHVGSRTNTQDESSTQRQLSRISQACRREILQAWVVSGIIIPNITPRINGLVMELPGLVVGFVLSATKDNISRERFEMVRRAYPESDVVQVIARTMYADLMVDSASQQPIRIPPKEEVNTDKALAQVKSRPDACIHGRSLLVTNCSHIGMGPIGAKFGDKRVVVPGLRMPLILRKRSNSTHYFMLGPAYVHGFMDGEAIEGEEQGIYKYEELSID